MGGGCLWLTGGQSQGGPGTSAVPPKRFVSQSPGAPCFPESASLSPLSPAPGSQVIFRVRRPAYLITSTMFIEDGTGEVIGEVHRRWSLLKRNYDLYM